MSTEPSDYQINDWIIERKTLSDLVVSLCDGRLFSQIHRLSESSRHTALLIEGATKDIAQYQISREAILGALCSIAMNFQMPILRSLYPSDFKMRVSARIACLLVKAEMRRSSGAIYAGL